MGTTVTEIMELADMHAYAQIADGTPARMLPRNLLQSKVEALIDLHTENEQLRAGYDAARLEIESLRERVQQLGQLARDVNSRRVQELEAQLAAVGAGGVEPLRKRCLHQISEPAQAQPVDLEPVAAQSRFLTEKGWGTCTLEHHLYVKANPAEWPGYETRALYAAPQPAAPALDAARYQFLRDGEWRDTELEPFIRLQLNTLWDAKIDAAIAAQKEGSND